MDIAAFRLANAIFADNTVYPDSIIQNALNEAESETGGKGWGTFENIGTNFKYRGMVAYASHWLVSVYPSGRHSTDAKSQLTAKSVGDESVSYSQANIAKLAAGDEWFLATHYGQIFLRLRRRAGMGAMAV